MNEYEKAAFLFEYLDRFKQTCKLYGRIPSEEAILLYFEKIELFKLQLQQEGITKRIAHLMFGRLSSSLLTQYLWQTKNGRLWQIKCIPFDDSVAQEQEGT